MTKPQILILCTGNSCRSQMAEAILQNAVGDKADVFSAGSHPSGRVHPLAIKVVAELGLDISEYRSKSTSEFLDQQIDTVITVCGNVDQICPSFPGQHERHHWGFDDPDKVEGTEEQVLASFRRIRDEIKEKFEAYAATIS